MEKTTRSPAFERVSANKEKVIRLWSKICAEEIPMAAKKGRLALIDSVPDYIDKICEALNPNSNLEDANRDNAIAPIHGFQRAEFGNYRPEWIAQEYLLLLDIIDKMLISTGGYTLDEYKILSKSIFNAATESALAFVAATEEKRAALERQFRLLVKEVKDFAIFILSSDGVINSWNEGARRIKLYEADEVIGKHFRILYRMEDCEEGRPERNLTIALNEGNFREQWWRRKKDGTLFWAEISINPIFDGDRHIGFAKVVHDLTDERKIHEELQQAKQAAEEANHLKTAFLANMSHEIRTPLGAILGFTEILKSASLPDSERLDYINIIDRNGRALIKIIDDILDISKVEAGKLEVERIAFDLRSLMAEVGGLFELRARDKQIALHQLVDGSVPQQVVTDPVRLRQILTNIIGNAVKFTSEGHVKVHVEQIAANGGRPKLRFMISDTGPGIPEELQPKLFAPFAQADHTTTRKFGGTGLGLALSRKLARQLGGDVNISDCTNGVGCNFVFEIENCIDLLKSDRAKDVATQPDTLHTTMSRENSEARQNENCLGGIKVLLAEDAPDNQILLSKILANTGAELKIVNNGQQAVAQVQKDPPDIVLMDIQMPIMDGLTAAKKLKEQGHEIPMIALTAHAMREEVDKCLQAGFSSHISKPIDKKLLIQSIYSLTAKNILKS